MNNNIEQNPAELQSEEKMLAMFAHFSIFLGGIILPIIFYFMQKEKSKYVAFHSLQAIFFHILYLVVLMGIVMIFVIVLLITGALGTIFSQQNEIPGAGFIIGMIIFYAGIFGSILVAIAYAVYMGVKAYNGDMKKYIIVGNWAYKKVYGTVN